MKQFLPTILTWAGVALSLILVLIAFGLPLGPSLQEIASGSLTTWPGISRTLVKTTPLLLCGLGMVVAWKAGAFNIGGEGQFVVGALSAAAIAKVATILPGPALNPLMLVAAAIGGACYASIAGWMYIARKVPIVISTILLNFIALNFQEFCVTGPLQMASKALPQTDRLPDTAMLLRFSRQADAHIGILFAIVLAIFIWLFLYRTIYGFKIRLVGSNPKAAEANQISPTRTTMLSMAISGALCGLAGAIEFSAVSGVIGQGFSQGWGFLSIPVALLGNLHPLGVIASSAVFGALFAGSENLSRFASGGDRLIYVVQAVAVLAFVAIRAKSNRFREGN